MARTSQYEIGVGLDSGPLEKSVANGIVKPLEEAADAFDRLEDAADDARLDRELDKAQKATDELDDELGDARKALDKLGYAARKAGDDGRDGMRDATEGVQDFKQEAQQSAKETAASFSGSADDIGGMFQEVAANAFSGFGPAGVAAGLGAAAGLGLVFAEMERQKEQAEQLKERLGGLYLEALESGRDYIDQAQFIAESNDLRFNTDRADEWKQLQADAKQLGLDENDIIKANAGDLTAIEVIQARINEQKTEISKTDGDSLLRQHDALKSLEGRWAATAEVAQDYKSKVESAEASTSAFLVDMIDQTSEATEQIDELGNKIVTLPNDTQIFIDAKTGLASQNLDGFKGDLETLPESKVVNVRMKVDESEWLAWQRKPREFKANVMVRGKEWQ